MLRLHGCQANIQNDYGAVIEKDDYMIVKIQTFEPENVAYHIDFYLVDETTPLQKHIGFAYVLPIHSNLELPENKRLQRLVPIIGLKHNPSGIILHSRIARDWFLIYLVSARSKSMFY